MIYNCTNPKAVAKLGGTLEVEAGRPFAYLIPEQYRDKDNGPVYFEFMTNPEKIVYNLSSKWTKSGAVGVAKQTVQWYQGDNSQISFPDLWLDSHMMNLSLAPLLDALKKLKDREPGKRQPPVLYFKWGSRVIGPIVMTECTITEEGWLIDGSPAVARVTLEFIEIPRPDETRNIVPPDFLTAGEQGQLPVELSEGVKNEADKTAKEWIKKNASLVKGNLGTAVKKGDKAYKLTTDSKTGLVTITSGKNSGIVGIYDGKTFYPVYKPEDIKNQTILDVMKSKPTLNTVFGTKLGDVFKLNTNQKIDKTKVEPKKK